MTDAGPPYLYLSINQTFVAVSLGLLVGLVHSNGRTSTRLSKGDPSHQLPSGHHVTSLSIMRQNARRFEEKSEIQCHVNEHVQMAVNVNSVDEVHASLDFAREHNVRTVIKNTGHEYMGRSAPARGTLSLWTHHLSSSEVIPNYQSHNHNGSAIRLGAGIMGSDTVRVAHENGLRIVAGFCPSVGIPGGYIQGGGHGPLSSSYGMAADQALEWEVVAADGRHIIASPTQHTELMVIFRQDQANDDAYWASFAAWQEESPALLDCGATAGYAILNDAFFVHPITIEGIQTAAEMETLLALLKSRLDDMHIRYTLQVSSKANFYNHYRKYQGPLPWGAYSVGQLFGGRLIPRVELDERPHSLLATVRRITEETHAFLGFVALNVNQTQKGITPVQPVANISALPAWRYAALTVLAQSAWNYSAPRADGLSRAEEMTRVVGPAVGSYMNEADFRLEDWQVEFYGAHWDILSGVKYRWDPEGLF
ncbi:long-chain-fatty-acid-CoA ligase [Penicillium coprophilum]|uniref:long-chain-fatty-acid-CoA ligase n=1 Tax=Penicillium coprophilum TaxID=36646 RepID=UPI00238FF5F6|nr:long-chain-fatty-acid-CoA ligase [Penicillium coprophilum]KAJ5177788.1 long-chain-fatty-acid-CoA ligase [Penicillium coprophilum]